MKAAILVESKKPLVVANVDLPKKLEYGQVLVKIFYSGICGAQVNEEIDAAKGPDKFLPHLLGHEGSGVVEKIGDGVATVKPGDTSFITGGKVKVYKAVYQSIFGMESRPTQGG